MELYQKIIETAESGNPEQRVRETSDFPRNNQMMAGRVIVDHISLFPDANITAAAANRLIDLCEEEKIEVGSVVSYSPNCRFVYKQSECFQTFVEIVPANRFEWLMCCFSF